MLWLWTGLAELRDEDVGREPARAMPGLQPQVRGETGRSAGSWPLGAGRVILGGAGLQPLFGRDEASKGKCLEKGDFLIFSLMN